jgi:microcystin-dependent protein
VGFLIPNATNTTSGNKFASLEQAEPDSIDFSILGRAGSSGVYSGCLVSPNNTATDVGVSAGIVVLGGTPYVVTANTNLGLPSAPINLRFDLVVARVAAGVATLTVIQGADNATNPSFPQSRDVITSVFNALLNVDFDTDVVLGAVFRDAGTAVTASEIVDKRVIVSSTVVYQGATVPLADSGRTGDLFFKNPSPGASSVDSGLYVRASDGNWGQLTKTPEGAVGPVVPIGGTLMWAQGAVPAGYLEWDGSTHPVATYPDLAALYGNKFGGDGITTFGMPNIDGRSLRGTTVALQQGDVLGADTVTLTNDHLPNHRHGIGSHDHPMPHAHSNSHGHTATSTTAAAHSHQAGSLSTPGTYSYIPSSKTGHHTHPVAPAYAGGVVAAFGGGHLGIVDADTTSATVLPYDYSLVGLNLTGNAGVVIKANSGEHEHDVWGATDPAGAHTHPITVSAATAATGGSSAVNTGVDTGDTTYTGNGNSFSNIPVSMKVRVIVRAL